MLKSTLRILLRFLHLDLTKNLEYDRYTSIILKKVLKTNSNTIDVGCHKGEILEEILKLSPKGVHHAFEPIPLFYSEIKMKFGGRATIYPYALSDTNGESSFQFVKNAPAFSGLKQRDYLVDEPEIEVINVEMKKLDDVLDINNEIDLVKIDVEGGEFGVLKGGRNILSKFKPIIIFECGLGASDHYKTKPLELFSFINKDLGLSLNTLKGFVRKKGKPLSEEEFEKSYKTNSDYYFVAYPRLD